MKPFFSLFVLAASLMCSFAPAHAQAVEPDPAPTIIMTAPITINTPGYYQLGTDLIVSNTSGNIITINASNVTLDFAGHFISGPNNNTGTTLVGVGAYEEGNLIIQNGTVAYCQVGIYLNGSGNPGSLNINQTVQNMLVSYCYSLGIQFAQASNSTMLNNRISFIGGGTVFTTAIGLWDYNGAGDKADGNTVTNVTTSDSSKFAYGISSTNGTLEVSGNTVSNVTNSTQSSFVCGINKTAFTVNNLISNCYCGIEAGGIYMGNLTSGCTVPFDNGTGVGVNN